MIKRYFKKLIHEACDNVNHPAPEYIPLVCSFIKVILKIFAMLQEGSSNHVIKNMLEIRTQKQIRKILKKHQELYISLMFYPI